MIVSQFFLICFYSQMQFLSVLKLPTQGSNYWSDVSYLQARSCRFLPVAKVFSRVGRYYPIRRRLFLLNIAQKLLRPPSPDIRRQVRRKPPPLRVSGHYGEKRPADGALFHQLLSHSSRRKATACVLAWYVLCGHLQLCLVRSSGSLGLTPRRGVIHHE